MSQKKIKKITPGEWAQCIGDLYNNCKDFSDSEYIFTKYLAIINGNLELKKFPSDFFGFINRCYHHSVLLFIRRLSDRRSDSISLVTLLQSFLEYPDKFMKIDPEKYKHYELSNTYICNDIHKILQVCEPINKKVNKRGIGHLDRDNKNPKYLFKQNEFDEALEELKKLSNKYFNIFGFSGFGKDEYEKAYDWQSIFTIPWAKVNNE